MHRLLRRGEGPAVLPEGKIPLTTGTNLVGSSADAAQNSDETAVPAISAQYAREADPHDAMRGQIDALQRDGFRQEQIARLTGIARPTLANWKAGRYALSAAAAQRLQAALASKG